MFIVDTTVKKIFAYMDEAHATTNPSFLSSWADHTNLSFTEGSTVGSMNGTTNVDILPAPATNAPRICKSIQIYNCDTIDHIITLAFSFNGTKYILNSFTLKAGAVYMSDGVSEQVTSSNDYMFISNWIDKTIMYSDYSAISAVSGSVPVITLKAGQVLYDNYVHVVDKFNGGTISAITGVWMNTSVNGGMSSSNNLFSLYGNAIVYHPPITVYNTNYYADSNVGYGLVATGGNLNALTRGQINLKYRTAYLKIN